MSETGSHHDWPKNADGTIDWESVFENPDTGLIAAINQARKPETLIDCTAMVVQKLFTREGDEDIRSQFVAELAMLGVTANPEMITQIERTTALLRSVKENRIERAADWAAHTAQREADRDGPEASPANTGTEKKPSKKQQKKTDTSSNPEAIFEDVFCDFLDKRFQAMWTNVPQKLFDGHKISFLISSEFARKYENIVRTILMPFILEKARPYTQDMSRQKEKFQKKYLEKRFKEKKTRKELWAIWEEVWDVFLTKRKPPIKPEPEPTGGGLLGSLTRIVKDAMSEEIEYTTEDWENDCKIVDDHNKQVRQLQEKLYSKSDIYLPPLPENNQLLINIFAISAAGLRKQIATILEISQEKGNVGRIFETYGSGKDLEMSLLAVSVQNPDIFLRGDKKMLPYMLGGHKKSEIKERYPILYRMVGYVF